MASEHFQTQLLEDAQGFLLQQGGGCANPGMALGLEGRGLQRGYSWWVPFTSKRRGEDQVSQGQTGLGWTLGESKF